MRYVAYHKVPGNDKRRRIVQAASEPGTDTSEWRAGFQIFFSERGALLASPHNVDGKQMSYPILPGETLIIKVEND